MPSYRITRLSFFICALILYVSINPVVGSHFRGGGISWLPLSQPTDGNLPEIRISWRVAWRRSSSAGGSCSVAGTSISGEGSISCSCGTFSLPLRYTCTDFSIAEDWTTGVGSGTHQPITTVFNLSYDGGAWLSLANGGGSWSLLSTVDLSVREDTGLINSSPLTSTPPIVRFKFGCDNTLVIPTLDVDEDDVRCFWATSCGGICGPVPGFELEEPSCRLTLSASSTAGAGLYGIAIEIKDFNSQESSTPLSQIPLQFLIDLSSSSVPCEDIPTLISPTRECGSCVTIPTGTTYTDQVVARAADGHSITSFEPFSPIGLTTSVVMPLTGITNDYFIDVSWDPGSSTNGEIFCVTPVDNAGNIGQLCCFTLLPSSPFELVSSSVMNSPILTFNDVTVDFTFSREIARPESSKFISLFDDTDTMLFQVDASDDSEVDFDGKVMSFVVPNDIFGLGGSFYITMDGGVAETTGNCVVESTAVTNDGTLALSTLGPWEFQCIATPPVLDLQSLKPIHLLALAGGGPDQFSMTFRGRDSPEYYSEGKSVEYSETKGTITGDESKLRRHEAILSKPHEKYHEANRFGVHYCNYFSNPLRYEAQLLIHNQKALIPKDSIRTIIVSVGETLTLCVEPNLPRKWKGPIVWSFDGLRETSWLRRWTGSTCIHVQNIQTCQGGVYEAYRRVCGRHQKQHAFFDVRVRECPSGFHTPPACASPCSESCVLGYCGDDGSCVCKNGMSGANCDTATAGHLGLISGDITCSAVGLDPECKGSLVCSQHAGCSCTPGWKGINCDEVCDVLQWGPDCAFTCEGGVPCDRFTGQT